jgi:hypothetical protein
MFFNMADASSFCLLMRYLVSAPFVSVVLAGSVVAVPCTPTDPEGLNPGNLCLSYPTHGMSINSNAFRQGYASEGYFGTPTGPSQPGAPILPGHIRGVRMDPASAAGSGGYWTSIDASASETRIRTNTGKEWILKTSSP